MFDTSMITPLTQLGSGGVPPNWLDNNKPFVIRSETCEGTVAKVHVIYCGNKDDSFEAAYLPQGGTGMSNGEVIMERYRIVLFRNPDGESEELVERTLEINLPENVKEYGVQFLTYDHCTTQEQKKLNYLKFKMEEMKKNSGTMFML